MELEQLDVAVIERPEVTHQEIEKKPSLNPTKRLFETMVKGEWTEVPLKDLKAGQIFRVDGEYLYYADKDPVADPYCLDPDGNPQLGILCTSL